MLNNLKMKNYLIIIYLILANDTFGQVCNCDSVFLQAKQIVEDNYAGWFDKVKPNNKSNYNEWTEKISSESKAIKNDSLCALLLQEWISYFRDKHLRIKFIKPKSVNTTTKQETSHLEILTTKLVEREIIDYFAKTKMLDPIEGIYTHPSYKLAITKIKTNLFYATILTTKNENWKPGEVKLVINKKGKQYSGIFYEGDKSNFSIHNIKLVDNILDFDIVFFEKISPNVKIKRDITEYEMKKDKYAPNLKFVNNIAFWKFPSFENNSYDQTAYLLEKYKKSLQRTPYWILDLTNNDGGDYRVGMQLIDYIYTYPIIEYNSEMRMTKENFEMWFNTFVKASYEELDEKTKEKWNEEFDLRKSKFGTMYNVSQKVTDTISNSKILPFPKKIALLINENTGSSGELFTMLARQSDKVVVLGNNSYGMMDYGNIVQYKTNYPTIRVQLPMDRQLWLDNGFSVDKEGLKPEIYLKGENWTEQAINIIMK